jgi:CopG family transcriptional regulator, nickel-responsive regulator
MSDLCRFGISLPRELVERFDRLIGVKGFPNRSKAIGDLIRRELVREEWTGGGEVAGAITLIYNHHRRDLLGKVTDVQHNFQKHIISTQHIHLDHDNCLEIVAVRGSPRQAQKLTDALKALKGIKHVTLSMSSTGRDID